MGGLRTPRARSGERLSSAVRSELERLAGGELPSPEQVEFDRLGQAGRAAAVIETAGLRLLLGSRDAVVDGGGQRPGPLQWRELARLNAGLSKQGALRPTELLSHALARMHARETTRSSRYLDRSRHLAIDSALRSRFPLAPSEERFLEGQLERLSERDFSPAARWVGGVHRLEVQVAVSQHALHLLVEDQGRRAAPASRMSVEGLEGWLLAKRLDDCWADAAREYLRLSDPEGLARLSLVGR